LPNSIKALVTEENVLLPWEALKGTESDSTSWIIYFPMPVFLSKDNEKQYELSSDCSKVNTKSSEI